MRKATLTRISTGDEGTFGELVADSGFKCVVAELPWRQNRHDVSCVRAQVVQVRRDWSGKHKAFLFHLLDPTRGMVEQHVGNLAGDVSMGYASDVEGCQLPGVSVGDFKAGEKVGAHVLTKDQAGVTSSGVALKALMADLGDEYELTIVWADGIAPEGA